MEHVEGMTLYLKDIIFSYESSEEGSVSTNGRPLSIQNSNRILKTLRASDAINKICVETRRRDLSVCKTEISDPEISQQSSPKISSYQPCAPR